MDIHSITRVGLLSFCPKNTTAKHRAADAHMPPATGAATGDSLWKQQEDTDINAKLGSV
jgi:hypothetical protein